MGFAEAVQTVFSKYATFEGRAARPEYWWWALCVFLGSFILNVAAVSVSHVVGVLTVIWALATVIPSLAVGVRRLHDIDRSGWWSLIYFVPLVGVLVMLYWFTQPGTPGSNRYG